MTGHISVTRHAQQRWIDRVDARATLEQADAAIRQHARAVIAAANFGCRVVKLANGAKLLLDGRNVVTVLARHQIRLVTAELLP